MFGMCYIANCLCHLVKNCYTPFTRYNRLSNRFENRFDNRLYHVNKHPTLCQTGCQTGLTTVSNEQPLFVPPVVKPGCTTGLTNTVWQPCWTNSCSFKRLQTGLTTGCIV